MKKIDEHNAGFWDRYFVIPLSHLLDFFKKILGNYGWSILLVTFLVRLVLFPLTWKQQKSTKEMQKIQPLMKKIQEKYKDKPQQQQEAMMQLFQKHKVNPMAGCLPSLIQLPILFGFYQAIMRNPHIADSSFLYMQLGKPDPYLILPILAAITTYLQLLVTGSGDNPQMRILMFIMPVMIFVFAYSFPSALSLYWFFGNILTILQYVLIFKPSGGNPQEKTAS